MVVVMDKIQCFWQKKKYKVTATEISPKLIRWLKKSLKKKI